MENVSSGWGDACFQASNENHRISFHFKKYENHILSLTTIYLHQFLKLRSWPHLNFQLSIITSTNILTLNAPIATKVVCFSRLLKCLRSLYGKQCGPRSDCSYGSKLFASILNLPVMLGSYLQQTTSADIIFRCIFFLGALRVNTYPANQDIQSMYPHSKTV